MPATAVRKTPRQAPLTDALQAGAGLRTFEKVAGQWKLSVVDAMALIGVDARSTYYELLRRARESSEVKGLSKDQLDRLSYVLGIYHSIRVLFPHSKETRDAWVSRANTSSLFGGRAPIELMRSGMVGLYQTFAHLAAVRS
jgi:hypothetical protein